MTAALAIVPYQPSYAAPAPREQWMEKNAVCERLGITGRALERYIAGGTVHSRLRPDRSKNGRQIREVLVASLPEHLRHKLEPPKKSGPQPQPSDPSRDPLPLFASETSQGGSCQRILLPHEEREALERLRAIQPILEMSSQSSDKLKYSALRLADGRAVTTADLLAAYLAETIRVEGKSPSRSTLWRWVADYRAEGLPALARKTRSDSGKSRFFTRYPEAGKLAAATYLKPHSTVQRAFEAICRDREMLGIPLDELPSYEACRNYLETLPESMKILARQGLRSYNERVAPHVARAYVDIPCNDTWVGDTALHDVETRNDCFAGVPMDAPMRLRLTAFMDMRSRKLVGYCWAPSGDWRSIATALRRGVLRYGPPRTVYSDNGSDYKKTAAGAKRTKPSKAELEYAHEELVKRGPLAQLGIAASFCIPYRAQAKPIERCFGTIHKRLDALLPGYLTGNAYERPDAALVAGVEHRKLLKFGRGNESSLPPASFFIALARTFIEEDYNANHHHSGQGMGGRTPDEVFNAGYPLETRRSADPAILDLLLFERERRLVRSAAIVLSGRRYMPAMHDAQSWSTMHLLAERTVAVAFDPLDMDRAIVLDERGFKAAELVAETLTGHSPEMAEATAAQIGAMEQMKRRLEKATYGGVKQIHEGVIKAGHKSELQHLAERAMLSVPVDDLVSQRAIRKATRPSETATAPASSFEIANEILGELG